jgi:uncharacterized membrane protein YccC
MGERVPDDLGSSQSKGPGSSALEDYAALEAVLSATPRGRWFLSEYARSNRRAETGMLLGAMSKLEAAVLGEQSRAALRDVFAELAEISEAIAQARGDIAQGDAAAMGKLTETLDSIAQRLNALIEIWKSAAPETEGSDPRAA